MPDFAVPVADGPIRGSLRVPPSKSIAQRALVLAALSRGPTELRMEGPEPEDVTLLRTALGSLCAERRADPLRTGGWTDAGLGAGRGSRRVELGMNATGLRFAAVLAGLRPAGARTLLTGRPRLLARPHRPLLRALRRLGAHVRRRPSGALRTIARAWTRHDLALDGRTSSQFASALLLAAPRAGGLRLRTGRDAVSRGYLALTIAALRAFGCDVQASEAEVRVGPGEPRAGRFDVEPDASSAAVAWTLAALSGGRLRVPGIGRRSAQPDVAILEVLGRMGAVVGSDGDDAVVEGPAEALRAAGDVDLRDAPDLAPLVGVLAARAAGRTRIVGAPHLRHKESDRIVSLAAALRAVGARVTEAPDGLEIEGAPGAPVRARVDTAGDHRLALAFGALGATTGGVVLSDATVVRKSWPGFFEALSLVTRHAYRPGAE